MAMKNHALILIDIQNDYFEGGAHPLINSTAALQNSKKILDICRQHKIPVIHIRHESMRPGANFFLPKTHGAQIHELLAPLHNESVFTKHFPNSFLETGLLDLLRAIDVKKLIFCGMMTHMCVDATVRAARDFGFECKLIGDACATRNLTFDSQMIEAAHVHHAFLAALSGVYAEVTTTEQFIAHHRPEGTK